ncbi:nicotinamidase-related amidase [Virgibacillus halotolerans]|uniref:cysteine hydrolase family protein n=1 Tax=Virgibacillus halotolerans TaxID=1071053 RepID=UPI001960CE1E|nr:isochorismatase family cysteine hydrolase [Virgibacillus halotolerans]MBM7600860.1 nicotinamidase-related amidase [Virgibacillus halotolerans]
MDVNKTALLLIDLQKEGGTSDVAGMDKILKHTAELIEACRKENIPIIYTRHINRADAIGLANSEPVNEAGEPLYYHAHSHTIEIADMIKPKPNDIIIDKYRYSGFFESNLELMLKSLGIKHLIIGGVLTDVCVLSTALDAYYRDYQINIVEDICGTTTEGAHMAAMLMMANWIYDLEVYESSQIIKKLHDEQHTNWKSTAPDQLQFSPENIREVFATLTSRRSGSDGISTHKKP